MTTKVSFNLPSNYVAEASHGILVGDFNNWNVDEGIYLEKREDGSMVAELLLTPGRTYEYRYLLSDGRWVNDDNNKREVEAFGQMVENCVIDVPLNEINSKIKRNTQNKEKKVKMAIKDDLTVVMGISKEIEAVLNADDIKSFKDLGKCTMKRLLMLLENAGIREKAMYHTSWTKQAKLAASDKIEELKALKAEIKNKN